jgi:hypothetical protein
MNAKSDDREHNCHDAGPNMKRESEWQPANACA